MCNQVASSCHPNPLALWQLKIANEFLKAEQPEECELLSFVSHGRQEDATGKRFMGLLSAKLDRHYEKFLSGKYPFYFHFMSNLLHCFCEFSFSIIRQQRRFNSIARGQTKKQNEQTSTWIEAKGYFQ